MLIYFYFCIWIYNCFIPFVERISFLPVFPLYPCPKSTVHKYVTLFLHFLYYPVDQFPCFDTIVCVCAHLLSHIQLCKPGSSDHGIFQQKYWSSLPFSCSRGSSQPRDLTHLSSITSIGRQILYHCIIYTFHVDPYFCLV